MFKNPELLDNLLFAGIVLAVAAILSRVLRLVLNKFFTSASELIHVDPTKYNFIKNAVSFIIFITAVIVIFYKIPSLRDYGVTLFAGAGVLAAIIGFASQSAFANIIGGIFIVIFKPFRVGDIISVASNAGRVEDITLRHTVIRNFENRRIIIPNNKISDETIINSSIVEELTCIFFEIGISYDANMDRAMKIIAEEAMAHPLTIDNRSDEEKEEGHPIVMVRVIGFGDSSVNLRGYVWAPSPADGFTLKCDLNKSIKERFDAEGIEIPFPYRTLVFKNNPTNESTPLT